MSRNGSGSYTLPSPFPSGFQNGTAIDAPTMNTVFNDIQSALTASAAADGQTPITGDWDWGGNDLTGVGTFSATAVAATDAAVSNGLTVGNGVVVTKGGVIVGAGGLAVTGGALADVVAIGSGGPNWTAGTGVPVAVQPKGSIWTRTDGGVGSTLYVSQGAGTWNAVAGV